MQQLGIIPNKGTIANLHILSHWLWGRDLIYSILFPLCACVFVMMMAKQNSQTCCRKGINAHTVFKCCVCLDNKNQYWINNVIRWSYLNLIISCLKWNTSLTENKIS
jgi:hypothetical protein